MIVLSRHITRGPPVRGVTYDWIMQTAADFWSLKVLCSTIELGVVSVLAKVPRMPVR